jgi:hypothetical protein
MKYQVLKHSTGAVHHSAPVKYVRKRQVGEHNIFF